MTMKPHWMISTRTKIPTNATLSADQISMSQRMASYQIARTRKWTLMAMAVHQQVENDASCRITATLWMLAEMIRASRLAAGWAHHSKHQAYPMRQQTR